MFLCLNAPHPLLLLVSEAPTASQAPPPLCLYALWPVCSLASQPVCCLASLSFCILASQPLCPLAFLSLGLSLGLSVSMQFRLYAPCLIMPQLPIASNSKPHCSSVSVCLYAPGTFFPSAFIPLGLHAAPLLCTTTTTPLACTSLSVPLALHPSASMPPLASPATQLLSPCFLGSMLLGLPVSMPLSHYGPCPL